jgi:hypothetical protein
MRDKPVRRPPCFRGQEHPVTNGGRARRIPPSPSARLPPRGAGGAPAHGRVRFGRQIESNWVLLRLVPSPKKTPAEAGVSFTARPPEDCIGRRCYKLIRPPQLRPTQVRSLRSSGNVIFDRPKPHFAPLGYLPNAGLPLGYAPSRSRPATHRNIRERRCRGRPLQRLSRLGERGGGPDHKAILRRPSRVR